MRNGARDELIQRVWHGLDPFEQMPRGLVPPDLQGWNHTHPFLVEAIDTLRPSRIVEVGVWKGASAITMANHMKANAVDGVILCVDTWLGAVDHWVSHDWWPSLKVEFGQPMLMRTFMTNVLEAGAHDIILPLPLDSVNAAEVLRYYAIDVDIVHIDAGHEYGSVISDLRAWWPLLRPGGILIGDDYYTDGNAPGLKRAFDEFFGELGISAPLENTTAKCRVTKPL